MRKLIIALFIAFAAIQANAQSWNITGNTGINPATNFIGSKDDKDIIFKRNNIRAGLLNSSNTSFGVNALNPSSTGTANTAIGFRALYNNTTGSYNSVYGYNTGLGITTGSSNTIIGSNITGLAPDLSNNIIIADGDGNRRINIDATGNVGVGTNTPTAKLNVVGTFKLVNGTQQYGYVLTSDADGLATWQQLPSSGWSLTGNAGTNPATNFIGTTDYADVVFKRANIRAGLLNFDNTSFGVEALSPNSLGKLNTAVGSYALSVNTTGNYNTANGYDALGRNNKGNDNTAIGLHALRSNTDGSANTAIGYQSLYTNTGDKNTASGWRALFSNTTGTANTANGLIALYTNTTGNDNTANGLQALLNNTTGSYNTASGEGALQNNATGNYNTAIGYYAGSGTDALNNTTAIGYGATTSADNEIIIGNSAITTIGGYQDWTNISDSRVKKDITENVPGLAFINKLRPVTYHLNMDVIASFLKTPEKLRLKQAEAIKGAQLQTGFIAQEVEKTAQKLNFEFSGVDKPKNQNDLYGLRYAEFTVPLVKAVQELSKENDSLKEKLNNQQQQIDNILQQINQLKLNNPSINNTSVDINKKDIGITTSTLKVYPNPANQSFTIASNYELKDVKIQLTDMVGNFKNITIQDIDKYSKRILTNNLSAGIYIITVNNGQKIESTKIIIQ